MLAHRCDWEGSTIVAVHELGGQSAEVPLPVDDGEALVDLFGDEEHALPATLVPQALRRALVPRAARGRAATAVSGP